MQHRPASMSAGVPAYAVALAGRAVLGGKIVIYAGAGISVSQPTSLPTGAQLAAAIHTRLAAAFPVLTTIASWDLVAIADAVAASPGGEEALRVTAADAAHFKTAKLGYAHKILALLMLEGAVDVITTNWDNCIERGAGDEQLLTVTNSRDLADVTPPWVLKVHGCSSRPDSLLLTSAHLSNPPMWVQDQTRARLGSAVVVFIGIGDVAGYVRQRIEEAIADVGSVDNIRVVAPSIDKDWDGSQWSTVASSLADVHKISATADLFMEQLAAAYIIHRLGEHHMTLFDDALAGDFDAAKTGLLESDSLKVLRWTRTVDINPMPGESVLRSAEFGKVLIALGHLAGDSARLNYNHTFDTNQGPVQVLIATQTVPTRRLVEEAENWLHHHASRGHPHPRFVVAGGVGPIPRPDSLPDNILGEEDVMDIVHGPSALVPEVRHADEVLAS